MTRYAVGDLQGCLQPLLCLLEQVNFDSQQDQLWLVGDLINRGPASLATLRYIKALGDCCRIVLGNHDLHFLAVACGAIAASKFDTFEEILNAPDRDELVHWLSQQPLLYSDPSGDFHMTHAGIPPNWSLTEARRYAQEVEAVLRSDSKEAFLRSMYGNQPAGWQDNLQGWTRLRVITNYFTRMRFCTADGQLDFKHKLTAIDNPALPGYAPWFSHPQRLSKDDQLIFGHWAALEGKTNTENVYALDTGCVWGNSMTLMNLENKQRLHCDCPA